MVLSVGTPAGLRSALPVLTVAVTGHACSAAGADPGGCEGSRSAGGVALVSVVMGSGSPAGMSFAKGGKVLKLGTSIGPVIMRVSPVGSHGELVTVSVDDAVCVRLVERRSNFAKSTRDTPNCSHPPENSGFPVACVGVSASTVSAPAVVVMSTPGRSCHEYSQDCVLYGVGVFASFVYSHGAYSVYGCTYCGSGESESAVVH